MNRFQIVFVSTIIVFLSPWIAYADFPTTSHKIISGRRCINLRAEPSIDAGILSCLAPGTEIHIYRIPPTGRFVWTKDQTEHLWYRALVSSTNISGWISPYCVDILENPTEACTDFGS